MQPPQHPVEIQQLNKQTWQTHCPEPLVAKACLRQRSRPSMHLQHFCKTCSLCVLCKLGSGAFWPAKHIHCRRAAASAAAASVSLVLHTCLSCTYLYHAARSDAVRVPCVSALLTMLSPLRLSGSQAFFRVLSGPAVVQWILLATPGPTTRRQSL